jgi:Uroporphyrinogen decarboxylase (URO-D)
MGPKRQRVLDAFAHTETDRTPLFELFQPYHPIHWEICGRGLMTDHAYTWDAMAEGVSFEELVEAEAQAKIKMAQHFDLDMMHVVAVNNDRHFERPVKTGPESWTHGGMDYGLDHDRGMIFPVNAAQSMHQQIEEDDWIADVEGWDSTIAPLSPDTTAVFRRVKELADEQGMDIMFMHEQGAGTATAFYLPFQLMLCLEEPELVERWMEREAMHGFQITAAMMDCGADVIAMGGDIACDRGPFIGPHTYRDLVLPTIQKHINLIHEKGGLAVYTSDGNLWDMKQEFFFDSGADGYKEVDYFATMTMERLIEEGIKDKVCIIGNIDARHILCTRPASEVREFVHHCLKLGCQSPGGHILHASHSVHEDVKVANYIAAVNAYREFFGMDLLPK